MNRKERCAEPMSRRCFLRAGALGVCALCLAGLGGCAAGVGEETPEAVPGPGEMVKGLLRTLPSPWFTSLEGGEVRCTLCPHACVLAHGARGACRVRENREGRLYSLVYGNPVIVRKDPVERSPFFHFLPGARMLSLSTAGCNLHCDFCEVWDMALVEPEDVYAHDIPPAEVVAQARSAGVQVVSYAFGEPVIYYEYMAEAAALARQAGLYNIMHSAGYIQPAPLEELAPLLDAVNLDLKGFDEEFYRQHVGGELSVVLETLQHLHRLEVPLELTTIIIPGLNDDMARLEKMCRWIAAELGPGTPLHLARFYPLYRLSALPRTPVSTLEEARAVARGAGLQYVYISRVTGHEAENTFCAHCGEKVVSRVGYVIDEVKIDQGACPYCGTIIPGLWA